MALRPRISLPAFLFKHAAWHWDQESHFLPFHLKVSHGIGTENLTSCLLFESAAWNWDKESRFPPFYLKMAHETFAA
jgi:hypothetical protein